LALKYFFDLHIKTFVNLNIFTATFGIGVGAIAPIARPPWLRVWNRSSAMKNNNIGIGPKKALLVELYVKSNQSNLISRASSLAPLTIWSR